jgi:poly-gamma-glutamate synthesis protein (capsule biosynthesis protein)
MKLFLCGDVMTGRGIDQVLAHPGDAAIHERYVRSARSYVTLAEAVNGPIRHAVDPSYIWGDALEVLDRAGPDLRIVNLETAITTNADWVPKGINYRMHPANASCLAAARLDCCVLANNHVLDWGERGLIETLDCLRETGIAAAGAGTSQRSAEAPAILPVGTAHRVLVFALGARSSGIPASWAATAQRPGIAFLPDVALARADEFGSRVSAVRRPGDLVIASVHWGGNWGYSIDQDELEFAHAMIERAGVDVVHGHSSHHPKGIAVHRGKLVLWGCGDFINDYEGIGGHDEYHPDLGVMYLATLDDASGDLVRLDLVAIQRRKFQVRLAAAPDADWLCSVLDRESVRFGASVGTGADRTMSLRWQGC